MWVPFFLSRFFVDTKSHTFASEPIAGHGRGGALALAGEDFPGSSAGVRDRGVAFILLGGGVGGGGLPSICTDKGEPSLCTGVLDLGVFGSALVIAFFGGDGGGGVGPPMLAIGSGVVALLGGVRVLSMATFAPPAPGGGGGGGVYKGDCRTGDLVLSLRVWWPLAIRAPPAPGVGGGGGV